MDTKCSPRQIIIGIVVFLVCFQSFYFHSIQLIKHAEMIDGASKQAALLEFKLDGPGKMVVMSNTHKDTTTVIVQGPKGSHQVRKLVTGPNARRKDATTETIVVTKKEVQQENTQRQSSNNTNDDSKLIMSNNGEAVSVWPSLNIVGMPKCGTSHMYKILSSHADACALNPHHKEFCRQFFPDDTTYLQNMTKYLNDAPRKFTVNGCIVINEAYQFRELAIQANTKHIVMLRDPADMMWASYNFWALPVERGRGGPHHVGDWADPKLHHRSPEAFHEVYKKPGGFWRDPPPDRFGVKFPIYTKQMIHAFGKDNVLFVKSEDMKDSTKLDNFMKRLANFTGLSADGFSHDLLSTMTNCGDAKGVSTSCNLTSTNNNKPEGPVYSISKYQPMLQKTRDLVYQRWWITCKFWSESLNIVYESCLRDGAPTANTSTAPGNTATTVTSTESI